MGSQETHGKLVVDRTPGHPMTEGVCGVDINAVDFLAWSPVPSLEKYNIWSCQRLCRNTDHSRSAQRGWSSPECSSDRVRRWYDQPDRPGSTPLVMVLYRQ